MTMLPHHDTQASLHADGGRWVLRLIRRFPQESTDIWAALTDPALLAQWTPMEPDRPMTTVGSIIFTPTDVVDEAQAPYVTEVVDVVPQNTVAFRWGEDTVRFSVYEESTTVICVITGSRTMAPAVAAGWHLCLGALELLLRGERPPQVVGQKAMAHGWPELHAAYAAAFDATDPPPQE